MNPVIKLRTDMRKMRQDIMKKLKGKLKYEMNKNKGRRNKQEKVWYCRSEQAEDSFQDNRPKTQDEPRQRATRHAQ